MSVTDLVHSIRIRVPSWKPRSLNRSTLEGVDQRLIKAVEEVINVGRNWGARVLWPGTKRCRWHVGMRGPENVRFEKSTPCLAKMRLAEMRFIIDKAVACF